MSKQFSGRAPFKPSRCLLVVSVFSLFGIHWLSAQGSRSAITGRVVDSSGAILQGARIQLEPTGLSAASDAQGAFGFADIPSGSYKVSVSYVGFNSFAADVTVAAGETKTVDARMDVNSTNESVLVTAPRTAPVRAAL